MISPQPEDGADGGSLGDSTLLRIIHLGAVVTRRLAEELAPYELSPTELAILLAVGDRPDCTAVMIAEMIPVDTPSISRSVQRLVQKGILARRRSESDRRLVFLRLTSKGDHAVNTLLPLLKGLEQRVMQALDGEQAREYRASMDAVFDGIFPPMEGGSSGGGGGVTTNRDPAMSVGRLVGYGAPGEILRDLDAGQTAGRRALRHPG